MIFKERNKRMIHKQNYEISNTEICVFKNSYFAFFSLRWTIICDNSMIYRKQENS